MNQTIKIHKEDKYELFYQKGYFLPPFRSPAVAHDCLDGWKQVHTFAQKFVDVKLRGCYWPPTKELIFDEIKTLMEANNYKWGIKDAAKVPKE